MNIFLAAALLWPASVNAASPLDAVATFTAAPGLEFYAICRASKLPCAIEIDGAVLGDRRSLDPFRVEDETISKALSRAIQLYPGHRWRLRKGVLYVTPNVPIAASPLDRKLDKTKFVESLESARAEFGAAAGFCSVPRAAAAKPADEKKVSFEVEESSATPRSVLTGLVFRRGDSAWIVERARSKGPSSIFCLDLVDYGD
jgi:hypothetical protein